MRKKIWKWFWIILIIYVAGGAALYFLQDVILFRPVRLSKDKPFEFSYPHKEINITVDENEVLNIVDFETTQPVKRGIVLYFHGNRRNISWYAKYTPHFTKQGYQVLMIDYPGYGKSRGKLTEQKLYDWALQVYRIAHKRFPSDSIIIYGKSMGTGIAAQLASVQDCKRLILETPYYDFPAVISNYLFFYPVRWMLHYDFPTYSYIKNVAAPITIFHGTRDLVITYRNAKRLKPLLKPTDEFVTVKGGRHNNLFKYEEVLRKLDSVLTKE